MNLNDSRGVIRISTQPRQKYKILTGRKNCFLYTLLISHKRLFHTGAAKNPVYLRSFLLGKIIKIVISSNLQRKPSIFKEYFAWKKNKDFFIQICQAVWAISYSLLCVVSKINQGSCLGCLGGDDAPDIGFLAWQNKFCPFFQLPLRCVETFLSSQETFFGRKLKHGRMSFLDQCNVETASRPDLFF